MAKNTPEELQELTKNLLDFLEQNDDCSKWECSECPFDFKMIEEYPQYRKFKCGWLYLKYVTSKILRN